MASATPDLRLPSESHDIAAPRLVPNYTAWWQRHVCEQLAQDRYLSPEQPGVELANSRVASQRPNYYTTRPHNHNREVCVDRTSAATAKTPAVILP